MPVHAILEGRFQHDLAESAVQALVAGLPDTRAFAGNLGVQLFTAADDPARFVLVERWESREAQKTYMAWRADGNQALDRAALDGPLSIAFFDERFSG